MRFDCLTICVPALVAGAFGLPEGEDRDGDNAIIINENNGVFDGNFVQPFVNVEDNEVDNFHHYPFWRRRHHGYWPRDESGVAQGDYGQLKSKQQQGSVKVGQQAESSEGIQAPLAPEKVLQGIQAPLPPQQTIQPENQAPSTPEKSVQNLQQVVQEQSPRTSRPSYSTGQLPLTTGDQQEQGKIQPEGQAQEQSPIAPRPGYSTGQSPQMMGEQQGQGQLPVQSESQSPMTPVQGVSGMRYGSPAGTPTSEPVPQASLAETASSEQYWNPYYRRPYYYRPYPYYYHYPYYPNYPTYPYYRYPSYPVYPYYARPYRYRRRLDD